MCVSASAVLLIVHRTPVRGLELELLARAAFPATMPIINVSTPAEAFQVAERCQIAAAILEETPDLVAFATHASVGAADIVVGWVRNGVTSAATALGVRLNDPVTLADLADLARAVNEKRGS